METIELKEWIGLRGKLYADDNLIDPSTRVEGYKKLIGNLSVKTVLEVGCNRGHNLAAISTLGDYELHGIDPCEYAIDIARKSVPNAKFTTADAFSIPYPDSYFDLVFTTGVLMHIASRDLPLARAEMCRVSKMHILVIEYDLSSSIPGVGKDPEWDVALRLGDIEYLVYRNYGYAFSGFGEPHIEPPIETVGTPSGPWLACMSDGPVDENFGNEKLHYWLFTKYIF